MDERKDEELQASETAAEELAEEQAGAEEPAAEPEATEAEHGREKGFRGARAARREAELKKELEQLKEERDAALAAEKDKYLRLAAEYDNYRKRSQKERENVYADAKADTVLQLLPVYDNLERALKAECSDGAFYKGVEMIMDQLMGIFGKLGAPALGVVGAAIATQLWSRSSARRASLSSSLPNPLRVERMAISV